MPATQKHDDRVTEFTTVQTTTQKQNAGAGFWACYTSVRVQRPRCRPQFFEIRHPMTADDAFQTFRMTENKSWVWEYSSPTLAYAVAAAIGD